MTTQAIDCSVYNTTGIIWNDGGRSEPCGKSRTDSGLARSFFNPSFPFCVNPI